MPVIIEPHARHGLETHRGAEKCADQGYQVAEHGDRAGDDIGDKGHAARAANPHHPMDDRVGGQVARAAEDTDENVLARNLHPSLLALIAVRSFQGEGKLTWTKSRVLANRPGRANP